MRGQIPGSIKMYSSMLCDISKACYNLYGLQIYNFFNFITNSSRNIIENVRKTTISHNLSPKFLGLTFEKKY